MKARTTKTRKPAGPLPLYSGDRMTQKEFHRRYESRPDEGKFELIGGIVYMASPLKRKHGTYDPKLSLVLSVYEAATAGVEIATNMTAILGEHSEPQPDAILRILTEFGGQSKYNEDDYLVGPPELVAEIAHSSRAIDMNRKRLDYLESGVQEYVVLCVEEQELSWFHFPSRQKLKPDRHGVWKSRVFPGLWLDGPALIARDSARLIGTAQRGLARPEHATFVQALEAARRRHGR
jgi:Uma2 family endonuclease